MTNREALAAIAGIILAQQSPGDAVRAQGSDGNVVA
jgi:hypothetical protein